MKLRTLIIVAVALAVVTMAGYTIRNASLTTPEDDPIIGTQVFDQDILKEVNRVEINKAGSEAVLELNQSGEWVVRSLYDLPTDFAKLNGSRCGTRQMPVPIFSVLVTLAANERPTNGS